MNEKKIIQKIVLGGVIFKGKKILILQRHQNEDIYPGMWELPSGKRNLLEPSEAALLREISEESGLNTEIVAPVSVFDYSIEKKDEIRDSTQINFLLKLKNEKQDVSLSLEHQNYAWILESEVESYNLTDSTKIVLRKAFLLIKNLFNF